MEIILNAIKWHHLAFPVALVFIILFKEPLSNLISRITSINKKGVEVGPSPETQREKTETTNESVQQLLDMVGSSIVINEQVEKIQSDLQEKGLTTEGDIVKVLTKHLAGTQILLAFEQIHSLIFGSQITLLKKLNEVRGPGIRAELVNEYIVKTIQANPVDLRDWTVEQYLLFLSSQLLIVDDGEQIHITHFGVEYLTWMARNGRSEDRVL